MATALKLYETVEALDQVAAWLEENEGELTPELEALCDMAGHDFTSKVEAVAAKITEFKATAKAQAEEAARLSARAKASTNNAERLARYLESQMERAGTDKVKGLRFTVALQNNPPAVDVDTALLDDVQLRVIYASEPGLIHYTPESWAIDKRAVLDAFKNGRPIPAGCEIVVRRSLRIR